VAFNRSHRRGFGQGMDRAFRQKLDRSWGGHGSRHDGGVGGNLAKSIWNEIVAPENNNPGREFSRRGWNTNLAGMASQEFANGIIRGARPGDKKRGR
jgi:hypothetical protein